MVTLALPERWTFAGVDLSSYATITMSPTGADEFPALRGSDAPKTGLHGTRFQTKLFDARRVSLALYVSPLTTSGAVGLGGNLQARANLDALYAVLGLRTQGTLTRLMPDGTTRSGQAECVAVNSFKDDLNHEALFLVAQFQMADPMWYAANTTGPGATSIAASPTNFTFTNPGNARGNKMLVDFTGPITNPRLTNQTTGAYVDIAVVVASAKHLVIDADLFTVRNDGVDATPSMTHGPTVPYIDIAPGANSLQVTAGTPGGSVLVSVSPAYY